MRSDRHQDFEHMIDQSLAGEISAQNERSLREHLGSCAQCQQFLALSKRAVGGLSGFSFDVDPSLNAKVHAALNMRAQQIEATQPGLRRLVWGVVIALALTVTGSFLDLIFGGVIASVFDLQPIQVRHDLFAFWIVPSLCLLLLFPILPWLSAAGNHRKERIL